MKENEGNLKRNEWISKENTGRIVVQIVIHLPEGEHDPLCALTYVDSSKFVCPVQRLGVSGGTAPFFSLELTEERSDYWIGKDLSRAMDEVHFYEKVKSLSKHSSQELQALQSFMFEYAPWKVVGGCGWLRMAS